MQKKVILLNGSSSSGKSTIADVLKTLLQRQGKSVAIVSIDDFLKMTTEEPIYEEDVFAVSQQLCEKAKAMLQEYSGIIIDHVITSERIYHQMITQMESYEIHPIQVTCPLNELVKRETERENRCLGSAQASAQYLFPQDGYDLTVDTFKLSAEECAMQIMNIILIEELTQQA